MSEDKKAYKRHMRVCNRREIDDNILRRVVTALHLLGVILDASEPPA